jgi:hypothetical protein
MTEQSPYVNGPYVVLSDGDTYDGVEGVTLRYVTDEGLKQLEEAYSYNAVGVYEEETVLLSDLIDAYNKVHGTDL